MTTLRLLIALFVIMAFVGCGSRLNVENFNRVKVGMTLEEVKQILGEPAGTYQTIKTWQSGSSRSVTIEFDDQGKVVSKDRSGF
ncbi:MAG: outer membrane protein assembly factor BamE [Planctomycetes bacterium]|nr:outer membrane protein assembly factor BamE [Planctomycetota bacterium]